MRLGISKSPYFVCSVLMIVGITSSSAFGYMATYPPGRFINHVFPNVTTSTGILYSTTTNPLNNNAPISLYLDIYQPQGDTCSSRPCMVCMYGGGFTGGDRTGPGGGQDAQTFANYGYVGVAPDYRMWGTEDDAIFPDCFETTDQDARAVIRFLRTHAAEYKIDTARIGISGCSSGAFITLNVAYLNEPGKIPPVVDTTKYGGLDSNGGASVPIVSSSVCCAAGNSGAILDTNWIEANGVPYMTYQEFPDDGIVFTGVHTMWTDWTFYGIIPISIRCAHLGLLCGLQYSNAHCAGGFGDAAHLFLYNAFSEVGRKSNPNSNIAISKNASQSSTNGSNSASKAVDGSTDGSSYAQTTSTSQPWWQVDLGQVNIVDSVYTYGATANTDTGYDIKYSLDNQNWEICAYEHFSMSSPSVYKFRGGIYSRYIRVQLRGTGSLNLAEVEVFGRDTSNVTRVISQRTPNPAKVSTSSYLVRFDAGTVLPVRLKGSNGDAVVYNLMGKLAGKGAVRDGKFRMDGSSKGIKSGMYLLMVSPLK